jgi:hypothetical protein
MQLGEQEQRVNAARPRIAHDISAWLQVNYSLSAADVIEDAARALRLLLLNFAQFPRLGVGLIGLVPFYLFVCAFDLPFDGLDGVKDAERFLLIEEVQHSRRPSPRQARSREQPASLAPADCPCPERSHRTRTVRRL